MHHHQFDSPWSLPVKGIFSSELTYVLTPFPPTLLDDSINCNLVCAQMHPVVRAQQILDIPVLDVLLQQQKHPACTIWRQNVTTSKAEKKNLSKDGAPKRSGWEHTGQSTADIQYSLSKYHTDIPESSHTKPTLDQSLSNITTYFVDHPKSSTAMRHTILSGPGCLWRGRSPVCLKRFWMAVSHACLFLLYRLR